MSMGAHYVKRDDGSLVAFVRYIEGKPYGSSVFGPKPIDHPSIGFPCGICGHQFIPGDMTLLGPEGPDPDDEEMVERARVGRVFNAIAKELHVECAMGPSGDNEDW